MKPKKPIKVYLQYPWKFPDSPYYKYLIDSPPEGIEYLNTEKQKGVITNKSKFLFSNRLKKGIRTSFSNLRISIPNAHKSPKGDYDLIHCAHCLSKNKNKPWVADIESEWQFYVGRKNRNSREIVKKIWSDKNCKRIMPWTEYTRNEILKEFPEIKNKVEVVYPAVPLPKINKIKHKGINLLFVGRYFYEKGGLHALEVIDRLTKKHENVKGVFVSEVPREILEKYSNNKKIRFYNLIPQEKLFKEIMPSSDILIYPGYSDSFGFIFLEAMSFGIPVVTVDGVARKEIVEEGKIGFVIKKIDKINRERVGFYEEEIVRKIVLKTEQLIENKKLREKMSKNCINEIKNGKFSIRERNKKLKRIYSQNLLKK